MNHYIMKRISTIISMVTVALLLVILSMTSCNDAKYDTIDSRIYIQETGIKSYSSTKVTISDENVTVMVTPRTGQNVVQDTEVKFKIDAEALKDFNQRNGTSYEVLPEDNYIFDNPVATVKNGTSAGTSVAVTIMPLSEELLTSGKQYALPLAIESASGIEVMKGADVMIYIVDPLIITSVPVINYKHHLLMHMRQSYALSEWAVEFRLSIDELGTEKGQKNNQALFAANAPAGMDGEIYTRFGDAMVEGNLLQIKNQGSQFNSTMKFAINTWYHIAFVNNGVTITMYINGVKDSEMTSSGKITNVGGDFSFGAGNMLLANVKVNEIRFWTKAITPVQIANNMFNIDPQSEGLEGYWKLNEGKGRECKDYTGHGNTAGFYKKVQTGWAGEEVWVEQETTPTWIHNVKGENGPDNKVEGNN